MRPLINVLIYVVQWVLFLGFFAWLREKTKRLCRDDREVFIVLAGLGYLCLWAYFLNYILGWIFSLSVCGLSLWRAPAGVRFGWKRRVFRAGFFIGLGYYVWSQLSGCPGNFTDHLEAVYLKIANDNILPRLFSEVLRYGRPIVFPSGDWQFSDRPPLQTGFYLLFSFFTDLKTYQAVGMILQLTVFWAIWDWLKFYGVEARRRSFVLALLVLNSFFFFNVLYVWPKLLSAAFFFWAWIYLVRAIDSRGRRDFVYGGACLALAMLSHTGIIFSFPLLAVVVARRARLSRSKFGRNGLIALGTLIAGMLPWVLYQKLYDPPGDRLLRLHLAGASKFSPLTLSQLIRSAYASLSVKEIIARRLSNLTYMWAPAAWPTSMRDFRHFQYEHLLWCGLFLIPLAALALGMRRGPQRAEAKTFARLEMGPVLIGLALSLFMWALIFYNANQTSIPQSSYGNTALMLTLTALVATRRPSENFWKACVLVQLVGFLAVWNVFSV